MITYFLPCGKKVCQNITSDGRLILTLATNDRSVFDPKDFKPIAHEWRLVELKEGRAIFVKVA